MQLKMCLRTLCHSIYEHRSSEVRGLDWNSATLTAFGLDKLFLPLWNTCFFLSIIQWALNDIQCHENKAIGRVKVGWQVSSSVCLPLSAFMLGSVSSLGSMWTDCSHGIIIVKTHKLCLDSTKWFIALMDFIKNFS